jgi:hypothetical protein
VILVRTLALVLGMTVCLVAPASSEAALQWQAPETVSQLAPKTGVNLAPDGLGLLVGFPTTAYRYVLRPVGGPEGTPQSFPPNMGVSGAAPIVGWFPDGSSLVADPAANRVAFRPSGAAAAIGTPQDLGSGGPSAIATVASGDAMIGLAAGTNGPVKVAFRPAGANSLVDMANAQLVGTGQLIGVALDPAGGVVVVYVDTGTPSLLKQAVRQPGHTQFDNPVTIASNPYRANMATDPSGYASLSWVGGPPGTVGYGTQIFASERSPGGSFGTPVIVGSNPSGDPQSALSGITSNGDALVAWSAGLGNCDAGGFINTSHNGGWGAATAVGGTAFPNISSIDGVASAGNTVAVAFFTQADGDPSCSNMNIHYSRTSFVRTGTSTPGGIVFDPDKQTVTEVPVGDGRYYSAGFQGMAVNPAGGVLYQYDRYSASGDAFSLLAREDRSGAGGGTTGGGGTPGGGAGGPGPSGSTPGAGHILPIVPRNLVIVTVIDPNYPTFVATCPVDPDFARECAFRLGAYAAFGAIPSRAKSRTATLLGSAKLVLHPGQRGRLVIHFTAAGKRALRPGRRLKVRIKVDVTARGQKGSLTAVTTISPRRHQRHRGAHKKH